jgi:hypothetical protein
VFEDFTMLDLALAKTDVDLRVTYQRGDGLGTAGNEKVYFRINPIMLNYASPALETEAGLVVSLDYLAYAPASANDGGLQVNLHNPLPTV